MAWHGIMMKEKQAKDGQNSECQIRKWAKKKKGSGVEKKEKREKDNWSEERTYESGVRWNRDSRVFHDEHNCVFRSLSVPMYMPLCHLQTA